MRRKWVLTGIARAQTFQLQNVRPVKTLILVNRCCAIFKEKCTHLREVPILIGLNKWKLGLPIEVKEGKWFELVATKMRLGWTDQVVYHHITTTSIVTVYRNLIYIDCGCKSDQDLPRSGQGIVLMVESFGVHAKTVVVESEKLTHHIFIKRLPI